MSRLFVVSRESIRFVLAPVTFPPVRFRGMLTEAVAAALRLEAFRLQITRPFPDDVQLARIAVINRALWNLASCLRSSAKDRADLRRLYCGRGLFFSYE